MSFLVAMMSICSIVMSKADFITKTNKVYENLISFEDNFENEALILNYVKCVLLHYEDISDFTVNGVYVSVYVDSNGYDLFYENKRMHLEVYDRQIIDYDVE